MIKICDKNNYIEEKGHCYGNCPRCGSLLDYQKDDVKLEWVEHVGGRIFQSIPIGYYAYTLKCPNCHTELSIDKSDYLNGFKED